MMPDRCPSTHPMLHLQCKSYAGHLGDHWAGEWPPTGWPEHEWPPAAPVHRESDPTHDRGPVPVDPTRTV